VVGLKKRDSTAKMFEQAALKKSKQKGETPYPGNRLDLPEDYRQVPLIAPEYSEKHKEKAGLFVLCVYF
jgi:hypothetical protein